MLRAFYYQVRGEPDMQEMKEQGQTALLLLFQMVVHLVAIVG